MSSLFHPNSLSKRIGEFLDCRHFFFVPQSKHQLNISVIVFLSIFSLSTLAYSFDKDAADKRWDVVRGTAQESSFLIDLFITERMPGDYPHNVRERFGEIADRSDAVYLLDKLIDPAQKKAHIYAYTLLKELVDKDFVDLFEEYFNRAPDQDIRNKLFNLLTRKNSSSAFKSAGQCLERLQAEGEGGEAVGYLNYMVRFSQPDVRETLIGAASSGSDIVRAASFVALRNYPDDEVLALTEKALLEFSEEDVKSGEALILQEGLNERDFSLKDIIENTNGKIEKSKLLNSSQQKAEESSENHIVAESSIAFLEAEAVDYLAQKFAPVLYLSYEGVVSGVDLRTAGYPYEDYIPISVYDLTSHPDSNRYTIFVENSQGVEYLLTNARIDTLGTDPYKSSSNYLMFSSLWGGGDDLDDINNAYRQLANTPTVYYKIFRDYTRKNPIAIQYWFFYFYNDWLGNHPGDWETITVFLNPDVDGVEVAYSTHYEANRHSWSQIDRVESTHPSVFVSNGGHGSYVDSGNTYYTGTPDNHLGNRDVLYPSHITVGEDLENALFRDCTDPDGCTLSPYTLKSIPDDESSWAFFEGRWGDQDSAPAGPHFRIDASNLTSWLLAKHPPYDPYNNCEARYGANIYGNSENIGPWYWAAGYGIDTPWESADDCVPIVEQNDFSWNLFLPAILAGASGDTVPTVTSLTGRVWMDRNIGASRAATSATDEAAYGDLYQWGRSMDGHEKRNSGTTTDLSSDDKPDHGNFITTTTPPFDWRSPQNDNLWQGGGGMNNPCPIGFRLPTADEWQAEMNSWSSKDAAGAYASPLKLVMPGQRLYPSGSISEAGLRGAYWSSTIDSASENNSIKYLLVKGDSGTIYTNPRAYGMSVRCIKVALQEGLVAHYEFEDNANDSSGKGNNGIESGNVKYVDGVIGKATQIGDCNNSGHIKVPNSDSLKFQNVFTVAYYVRLDSNFGMNGYGTCGNSLGGRTVFAKDHDRSGYFNRISINNNTGTFSSSFENNRYSSSTVNVSVQKEGSFGLNEWVHVALVINANEIIGYINGSETNRFNDLTIDLSTGNGRDLYLGKYRDSWYPLGGSIDDFRMYNRALSQSEIKAIYLNE